MSNIEVVLYEEKYRAQWDAFVLGSNNGTMFHLQSFFDYHAPGKFHFHHLLFFREGRLIAVLPGGITSPGVYESPVGASYGNFVLHELSFANCLELVDAFMGYCAANGISDVSLTAAPIIYQKKLSQDIDYALLWRGFHYDCHYISSVIDMREYDNDVLRNFDKTTRRTVRKIQREGALRIEHNEDYASFYPILLKNKQKHNVKPTHSFEDLIRLNELLPGRLHLFNAYLDDTPIAGSLNFVANERTLLVFYNMLLYEYDEYRPIYLLMHQVVRWAREHGFDYVDIGVSQDTKAANPMTPSMSLIEFKERFDSRCILRSTLRKRISV
ncbi:MAG TPA: GNAT family N-acetyltransferase [Candidatus Kapabacteria bacterium]|nr:GNAT family N-acetyltransferase [Candidatus Kapabacteria bacterium]